MVAETESGEAAIEAIRTEHPDVVLLDIELRDMSGFDVLQAPLGFVRIERSILVNLHRVAFGERLGHGAFALTTHRKGILEAMR